MRNVCNPSHLYEPHCAVACDDPVRQKANDCKVDLAEEEEQRKHTHDVHVHAVDLYDPEACRMRVFDAPRLVIMCANNHSQTISHENSYGN